MINREEGGTKKCKRVELNKQAMTVLCRLVGQRYEWQVGPNTAL